MISSKTLVSRALRGESVEHVPNGPLAVHFCARQAGYTIYEYSTDSKILADSVIRYYEKFKPDAVWISADTWVMAEAVGTRLYYADPQSLPSGNPDELFVDLDQPIRCELPDPASSGRLPVLIEALKIVVDRVGREAFVVGCMDQSPFSLACQLAGVEKVMLGMYTQPDQVRQLLDFCVECTVLYGEAMVAAGADMLSTGDSPAGLIGADLYRQFALPAEKKLFTALQKKTGTFLSLHICGDTTHILDEMQHSGAQVLELDHEVDLTHALDVIDSSIAIWGNVDPVGVLYNGTRELVADTRDKIMKLVKARSRNAFVLSSGCTLAPDTPAELLRELLRY